MATRIKQLSSKYTDILTRFRMLQSFDSCYIWCLLFCFVLQALSPVMTTLKTLKCSSNWPKCLFVTQSIHFGNHNLEIHSDVSEFTVWHVNFLAIYSMFRYSKMIGIFFLFARLPAAAYHILPLSPTPSRMLKSELKTNGATENYLIW